MINRILIRIKVVQMLYSYLLTRNEFKIDTPPASAARDKRFAYQLYVDLLLFILELSGRSPIPGRKPLPDAVAKSDPLGQGRLIKALAANDDVKSLAAKASGDISVYHKALESVRDQLSGSALYRDYAKKRDSDITGEVRFWSVAVNTVIARNELFLEAARQNPLFTVKGFESGIRMFVETIDDYNDCQASFAGARKALAFSLDKAYELYYALLALMDELTRMQFRRMETAKNKYLPSDEELNPNTRFVDNRMIASLRQNPGYKGFLSKTPVSWNEEESLLKSLLDKLLGSELYAEYMSSEECGFVEDCNFWRGALKKIIFPSEELAEAMEAKSVYWNDDLQVIGTFVLKTVKRFAAAGDALSELLPQFKDAEDAAFGEKLFVGSVSNLDLYRGYIDKFMEGTQWDSDRLAFMDMVIMVVAITELVHFPQIPIPVTLNEYIEIANDYSTPKSGPFINGILFSVINHLKKEGVLTKD